MVTIFMAGFLSVFAQDFIYDTHQGTKLSVEEFASTRGQGEIIVFGEEHGMDLSDPEQVAHHRRQVELLATLGQSRPVQCAMEFIEYPHQATVDRYLQGQLSDEEFQTAIGWSKGNPFAFYREQIRLPQQSGGRTLALNIPRGIASQVGRGGPQSLNSEQQSLLPPIWERGRNEYFARFKEVMGDHVPPEKLENYFWAQSLWDDTMAWNTVKGLDPLGTTVIVVGRFHVEYGHGLPSRLQRYGATRVTTLLQSTETGEPDARYGWLADFIWVHSK